MYMYIQCINIYIIKYVQLYIVFKLLQCTSLYYIVNLRRGDSEVNKIRGLESNIYILEGIMWYTWISAATDIYLNMHVYY